MLLHCLVLGGHVWGRHESSDWTQENGLNDLGIQGNTQLAVRHRNSQLLVKVRQLKSRNMMDINHSFEDITIKFYSLIAAVKFCN